MFFGCDGNPAEPNNGPPLPSCPENSTSAPDYWGNNNYCYSNGDIQVLQDFINNSIETLNVGPLDWWNNDGVVQWYELGYQEWDQGRLITFSTNFSPYPYERVYNSNLSGPIPESIGNLTEIKTLHLGAFYHEDLGDYIGTGSNHGTLSGNIPDEFQYLVNLETLKLDNNNLDGNIPNIFMNLLFLKKINLSYNQFSGNIPETIWTLTELTNFSIGENKSLEGEISPNIGNLTNLEYLWLGGNNFSGYLPSQLWELSNLIGIWIEDNNFSGNIPDDISNLLYLQEFNIHNNLFGPNISNEICSLNILMENLDSSYLWNDISWNKFDINNNNFCTEYPECLLDVLGQQDQSNCDDVTINNGDVNGDEIVDILDIVVLLQYFLDNSGLSNNQILSGDMNNDGVISIIDLSYLLNEFYGSEGGRGGTPATSATATMNTGGGTLNMSGDGFIDAVQITISHGDDFSIDLIDDSLISEYITDGNSTTLIILAPDEQELFTANGFYTLEEISVVVNGVFIDIEVSEYSTTYSLVSVLSYDNPPDCNGSEYDATDPYLSAIGGTIQIMINNDETGTIAIPYYCTSNFFGDEILNKEACEENGDVWEGGDYNITWEITDSGFAMTSDNPIQTGISETPFTILGTTLTLTSINSSNCIVMIFEAE